MQENKYSIKHWAKDERPREKLLAHGAENLGNSELLSILIHNGTRDKTAIDLARDVLRQGKGNVDELGKLTVQELRRVKGIGEAKAITITAALELGRRRQAAASLEKTAVSTSSDIAAFLHTRLRDYRREIFAVVFLNRANKIN